MKTCCLALAILVSATTAEAQGIRTDQLSIPAVIGPATYQLETVVVRPDDGGRYPLALINHGTPRDLASRATMSANASWPEAAQFARRGWTAVAFMRRGYGHSQGQFVESSGRCQQPDYVTSGRISADDLAAAARYMLTQDYVSGAGWISVGVSAGGLATVALSANPPPGLVAGIAFAPGRGSTGPDFVCRDDELVAAFGAFGHTSRIPLLWISAENDHFFGLGLVARMRQAFTAAGGNVSFVGLPAYGDDGHYVFNRNIPVWTPLVDAFLAQNGLVQRTSLLAAHPDVAAPDGLNARGRQGFESYLDGGPDKAFAIGVDGHFGWASGRQTVDQARTDALKFCNGACSVVNVNNRAGP